MNLLLDGRVVRSATGDEDEGLSWKGWDVRELRGKRARLQIVDPRSDGWGHINVDHILLADAPARSAGESVLWADFGPDFYAAVSWSDLPKRRIWIGWMSNWQYAGKLPTSPWRGAMSIPRELSLGQTKEGLRLVQKPVRELERLRGPEKDWSAPGGVEELNKAIAAADVGSSYEFLLDVSVPANGSAGFRIGGTAFRCDGQTWELLYTRAGSEAEQLHRDFPKTESIPIEFTDQTVQFHVYVDASSIEVFADHGTRAITSLNFPSRENQALEIFATNDAKIRSLKLWLLKPAWK